MPPVTHAEISVLTVAEILHLAKGNLQIPRAEFQRKDLLLDFVLRFGSQDFIEQLRSAAVNRQLEKAEKLAARKRKRKDDQNARRTAARLDGEVEEPRNTSKFLELPSDKQVKECYRQFYEATSNAAVEMAVCGVCAREVSIKDDHITTYQLADLPHSYRLVPKTGHIGHDLFEGCLLEPRGVVESSMGEPTRVRVCGNCFAELQNDSEVDKPPRLSLANNLWIGRIPWQLQVLTFPEQLLIALLYPRVYVFKLFPKDVHYRPDVSTLQRGMRGTVSTYDLDIEGAASMVQGNLMPRPASILPSVISVTFIGRGDLPKRWLRTIFRVRRQTVFEALSWLQRNNPKYYKNITIDPERIRQLPEDDVPIEILGVVRQTTDTGLVDQESAGYVPSDASDAADEAGLKPVDVDNVISPSDGNDAEDDADVIPLQATGTVDTDLSKLTANEMMVWGLANLWKQGQEGGYAIRHGRQPVSDFGRPRQSSASGSEGPDRPNFFEKAFPCLFPYGHGGIEADRDVFVDFREHIQWTLQYFDRRFRKHETFPFVAFGILQRREALGSAWVQMRRRNFDRDARIMASITMEKIEQARLEEEKNLPISDPAVRLLKNHVNATVGRVMGSDQSRYRLRSQIWSTSIYLGPPYLWITINPCDLHDPIAQIFAGENIDLDDFISTLGPDQDLRAKNIAADPYAAAKFFHFLIKVILETLFQVKVTQHHVKSGMGILGRIAAYFGTIESQGRGTLHLHLLLWLMHAPTSDEMLELLKGEEFRARIVAYIRANLRAYLPGLESAQSVKAIPREKDVAYNRPPKPESPDYDTQLRSFELRLARTEQVHTCKVRRCLLPNKLGQLRCKRKAPFECAAEDFVTEAGKWGSKRLYGFINGWIPGILVNARCNNDGKFLTNGGDTKNITFYVTAYAAKKQGKHFNLSAALAQGYAYHLDHPNAQYVDSLRDDQRLLLFRLVHTINREQELAAPMVISYLMGWGDVIRSHTYSVIYWSSFVGALLKGFPSLRQETSSTLTLQTETHAQTEPNIIADMHAANADVEAHAAEQGDDVVTLDLDSGGQIFAKCQVTDYHSRGEALSSYNLLDFFVDTYEVDIEPRDRIEGDRDKDITDDINPRRGRPRNERVRYLDRHPKANQKQRIVRSRGHRNLPNFIGRYFPQRDDPKIHSFYCACMLTLLKPWRNLQTDLKSPSQTWPDAFHEFLSHASERTQFIISGIQYFHDCKTAAKENRNDDTVFAEGVQRGGHGVHDEGLDNFGLGEDVSEPDQVLSEEGLANLIISQTPLQEETHGRLAVEIAKRAKIFSSDISRWATDTNSIIGNATGDDLTKLVAWKAQMKRDVLLQNTDTDAPQPLDDSATGSVERLTSVEESHGRVSSLTAEASLTPVDPSLLKADQFRAYDIIVWHLEKTLAGEDPPPLRMIIYGEGGTGKSKVIQTVTEAFVEKGAKYMLVKSAYTGVAASLIDGKTTHTLASLSMGADGTMSDETKAKLQQFWQSKQYVIIDEFSMIAKSFLALLSKNIGIGKQGSTTERPGNSFGGVNVILCGDLHQFPPVAQPLAEYLYRPINMAKDTIECQLGRMIYEEFQTVVILKQQMRISDPVWRDFLVHLRYGRVQQQHIHMLRKLIIGRGDEEPPNFQSEPWSNASLVTPRHAVRKLWNEAAARKSCSESGERLFVCTAEDRIGGRELNLAERYSVATRAKTEKRRKRKDLPSKIELSKGMKVLVTDNVETDLDVTNGARGEIVDIILHPDEPPIGDAPIVHLKYLPSYILVKLTRTRASQLDGLEESVIPVEVETATMKIKVQTPEGKIVTRTVRRRQYPITAAYAFTDYRSQGQTLPYVLVDIASPPSGTLNLFNLYVALSRSSGRQTIRLLRDFDEDLFKQSHDVALMEEDDRLEGLDEITKKWWAEMGRNTPREIIDTQLEATE